MMMQHVLLTISAVCPRATFHIIFCFYIICGTKYKLYLSATVKMIPIKASGSIPAVLVPQIAQSIT